MGLAALKDKKIAFTKMFNPLSPGNLEVLEDYIDMLSKGKVVRTQ